MSAFNFFTYTTDINVLCAVKDVKPWYIHTVSRYLQLSQHRTPKASMVTGMSVLILNTIRRI